MAKYKYHDRYKNDLQRDYIDRIPQGVAIIAEKLSDAAGTPIKIEPKPITLRLLIQLSVCLDCEVGAFVKDGKVYIGKGRDVAISIPDGYTIIAHTHPTTSAEKMQIVRDMRVCEDDVEVAVNFDGLVIYYNSGHCYNDMQTDQISGDLLLKKKLKADSKGFLPRTIGLDKEIDSTTLDWLNNRI